MWHESDYGKTGTTGSQTYFKLEALTWSILTAINRNKTSSNYDTYYSMRINNYCVTAKLIRSVRMCLVEKWQYKNDAQMCIRLTNFDSTVKVEDFELVRSVTYTIYLVSQIC